MFQRMFHCHKREWKATSRLSMLKCKQASKQTNRRTTRNDTKQSKANELSWLAGWCERAAVRRDIHIRTHSHTYGKIICDNGPERVRASACARTAECECVPIEHTKRRIKMNIQSNFSRNAPNMTQHLTRSLALFFVLGRVSCALRGCFGSVSAGRCVSVCVCYIRVLRNNVFRIPVPFFIVSYSLSHLVVWSLARLLAHSLTRSLASTSCISAELWLVRYVCMRPEYQYNGNQIIWPTNTLTHLSTLSIHLSKPSIHLSQSHRRWTRITHSCNVCMQTRQHAIHANEKQQQQQQQSKHTDFRLEIGLMRMHKKLETMLMCPCLSRYLSLSLCV